MSRTYRAEDVDPLIQDLLKQADDALAVAQQAHQQLEQVKAAQESEKGVLLQKIAAFKETSAPGLDAGLVDETLETLEDLAIISPGSREKNAAELMEDPNNALRILGRVLTLSAGAPSQGKGHPKSASSQTTEEDPDGWTEVIRNGA
jgi:hypothetical protein